MAGNQKYGRGISVGILDLNNSELAKEIKSEYKSILWWYTIIYNSNI